jgi:ankyrin repeat protein
MRARRQRSEPNDNEVRAMPRTRSGRAGRGGDAGKEESRILEDMVRSGHNDELAIELTKETNRANINTCNGEYALLHIASKVGNIVAIDLLVDAGADINLKDQSSLQHTPLDAAYISNQQKTAIYLIEKGAKFTESSSTKDRYFAGDIWTSTKDTGRTLLHWAARFGSCVAINALLLFDVPIDSQNDSGTTALQMACSFGHEEAVNLLLLRGASLQVRNYKGQSIFEKCKGGKDGPLATRLREIHNPLHVAVKKNDLSRLMELLEDETINQHSVDEDNLTAFQSALLTSQKEACQILLFGTRNKPDIWNLTPAQMSRIQLYLTIKSGLTSLSFLGQELSPLCICASGDNDVMLDWLVTTALSLPNKTSRPLITFDEITHALICASQRRADRAMLKLAEFGGDIYLQLPQFEGQYSRETLAHLSYGRVLPVELVEKLKIASHNSFKFKNWIRRRAFKEFLLGCGFYSDTIPLSHDTNTNSSTKKVTLKEQIFGLDICVVRIMSYL